MSIIKRTKCLILALLSLVSVFTVYAQPEIEPTLKLTPNKCVALRQGQMCYANVTLTWQSSESKNVCVFQSEKATALQCWQGATEGTFSGEIKTEKTVEFQLREERTEQVLSSAVLNVAWVYKKKRRAVSWRIF